MLINHNRCSRDCKAVLPYAHAAELKSTVKSSDQWKTCVLPEVNIITVGSVAVYLCNVDTSVDGQSATDVHSECSDKEKTFELPTCRHHHWRCRSFACKSPVHRHRAHTCVRHRCRGPFAIGAWSNLVHVCDVPRCALVFVNCMLKPPPPPGVSVQGGQPQPTTTTT